MVGLLPGLSRHTKPRKKVYIASDLGYNAYSEDNIMTPFQKYLQIIQEKAPLGYFDFYPTPEDLKEVEKEVEEIMSFQSPKDPRSPETKRIHTRRGMRKEKALQRFFEVEKNPLPFDRSNFDSYKSDLVDSEGIEIEVKGKSPSSLSHGYNDEGYLDIGRYLDNPDHGVHLFVFVNSKELVSEKEEPFIRVYFDSLIDGKTFKGRNDGGLVWASKKGYAPFYYATDIGGRMKVCKKF